MALTHREIFAALAEGKTVVSPDGDEYFVKSDGELNCPHDFCIALKDWDSGRFEIVEKLRTVAEVVRVLCAGGRVVDEDGDEYEMCEDGEAFKAEGSKLLHFLVALEHRQTFLVVRR